MIDLLLARDEMQARSNDGAALRYVKETGILPGVLSGAIGFYTVATIADCGGGRFDFTDEDGEGVRTFLFEAFDADGETVADLVAWPLNKPGHVLSMFGRLGLLGLSQALNPTTYFGGLPLDVHRNGLDWLRAECRGAAVVTPHLAAPILLDLTAVAGRDDLHTRQLIDLARGAVPRFDPAKFLSASQPRKAA